MAYLDRSRNPHRTRIVIAVAAVEALAILAVVRGLDVSWTKRAEEPPLVAGQIPLTPPPKQPEPKPQPSQHVQDAFDRPITPPLGLGPRSDPVLPDPLPFPSPTAAPSPMPSPSADPQRFTPVAARPLSRPAAWVGTNDYPARDLREGNQGVTGFAVAIGPDGRISGCAITRSSGFPGLDRATCDAITRRARFDPARDGTGAKVPGSYSGSIRWVIPD